MDILHRLHDACANVARNLAAVRRQHASRAVGPAGTVGGAMPAGATPSRRWDRRPRRRSPRGGGALDRLQALQMIALPRRPRPGTRRDSRGGGGEGRGWALTAPWE